MTKDACDDVIKIDTKTREDINTKPEEGTSLFSHLVLAEKYFSVCNEFVQIPLYHIPKQSNVFLQVKTFHQNAFLETNHLMTTHAKDILGIASKNRIYLDMQQNAFIREILFFKDFIYIYRTHVFTSHKKLCIIADH